MLFFFFRSQNCTQLFSYPFLFLFKNTDLLTTDYIVHKALPKLFGMIAGLPGIEFLPYARKKYEHLSLSKPTLRDDKGMPPLIIDNTRNPLSTYKCFMYLLKISHPENYVGPVFLRKAPEKVLLDCRSLGLTHLGFYDPLLDRTHGVPPGTMKPAGWLGKNSAG